MYLGIDIGGTKTLVAMLNQEGQILESQRFLTSPDYATFLHELERTLQQLKLDNLQAACAGVPGLLDRQAGIVHALGNLPWRDVSIRDDISKLLGGISVLIENDARLAGLSEAQLVKEAYRDVLFITVSTGIGGAFIQNGKIVRALEDTEMGKMPLLFEGAYTHWEDFAGGRAVVGRFNKKAFEITDRAEWQKIGEHIAYGLGAVCSILQPQIIILGGSVGAHANSYNETIMHFLDEHLHPVVRRPQAIIPAQRPNEAVIYGCYDLLVQTGAHGKTNR